ncbi:hypothetical protein [Nostoc sp. C110]|uniref:hypothetical protein n=1 Tax=Nostoc sp. C110 TaxID=3349876 RepID=UPI00370D540C
MLSEQPGNFLDKKKIIGLLASQPTPEQILEIRSTLTGIPDSRLYVWTRLL